MRPDATPTPGFAALERLASIASDAGDTVMAFFGTSVDVDRKEDSSPVTAADRAAHACIVRQLVDRDSGTPIVSEEGALPPFDQRQEWKRFWLVDPLDGTKEFILGNGEFTVNIALIVDGEPVLGVVGAPALNTIFLAARGCGSWRCVSGGAFEPLRGGADVTPRGAVRVVESRSHWSQELEAFLATLGQVERIKLGSSLKFCRIAEGNGLFYPALDEPWNGMWPRETAWTRKTRSDRTTAGHRRSFTINRHSAPLDL